jgi:glycerol-3-phosphate dehydrogenase
MKRDVEGFSRDLFDLIIIGGGITGACLAHDAALRDLRVALVEKGDFGAATSSASSKLLHGGIRYLPKAQFLKVRESARERMIFQRIAPHLTSYIPFLIPTVDGNIMKGRHALRMGVLLYEALCSGLNNLVADPLKKVPRGRFLSREEVVRQVPLLKGIQGLNGAQVLFECHMANSERMTLAFIKTAVRNGACVANHVAVSRFLQQEKRVNGVACRDMLTGQEIEIQGKIVANATGPFISNMNGTIEGLKLRKHPTGFSKGIHMVTRQIHDRYALAISSGKKTEGYVSRGGRHFFIIPWRGRSLIGTTNVPFKEELDKISVSRKDLVDFMEDINTTLPGLNLCKSDIRFAFAGLYPLFSDEIKEDTYQGTGEYQVVDHAEKDGVEGIVSVLGAKYTTARAVAEQAVDMIVAKLGLSDKPCLTRSEPLFEGRMADMESFVPQKTKQYGDTVRKEVIEHLIVNHGSDIDTLMIHMGAESGFIVNICPDRETLAGEVDYAVREEMACTLADVIFRRTGMGTIGHPGEDVLLRVAGIMAEPLVWTKNRIDREIESVNGNYQCLADL